MKDLLHEIRFYIWPKWKCMLRCAIRKRCEKKYILNGDMLKKQVLIALEEYRKTTNEEEE